MRLGSSYSRWAEQHRGLVVWLLAITVGVTVFFAWIGYARTLDPRDVGWIFHEDPWTHEIGWEQFRNAPLWQYPITKNGLYGLEWSSTVVFTDSIPIVALVLRPFSALLPHPCQYLGWWVLLSLILQAYFAARLVMLRTDRLRDAAIGCILFTTTPVLLERVGLQTGVGSHWLLLWALLLYLSERTAATRRWTVLLLLTISIHAYLFALVGAIWVAHLVACQRRGALSRRDLVAAGAIALAVVAWMHVLGYFLIGSGAAGGIWRSNFDLTAFLAPCAGARFGVLPVVYPNPWDGCAYLGAGMIILLAATAVGYAVRRRSVPPAPAAISWGPLAVVLVGLGLFAITNDITFANHHILYFRLPHAFDGLYDTFRGATRMMWPAYYLTLLGTLWLAFRVWPTRALGWVLAGATVLQLVDLSGHAELKRGELGSVSEARPLADPIWTTIAQHYRNVISVPAYHRQVDWQTLAWFAASHGLGCNTGYLSRNNPEVRLAGTRAHLDAVATGNYEPDTVYYFPSSVLWDVARSTMGPRDLALVADGFHLIVPGGRAWDDRPGAPAVTAVPLLGSWITFTDMDHAGLLVDGWSWPEHWGTWSGILEPSMVIPVPAHERVRVSFRWMTGQPTGHTETVRVQMAGETFEHGFVRPIFERRDTFEVTTTGPLLDVRFELSELERRFNFRPTGLALIAVRVHRASDPDDDDLPPGSRRPPVLDTWISFAQGAPGRDLLDVGWSFAEDWGTWSNDSDVSLVIPVPAGEKLAVTFRWSGISPPRHQKQAAQIWIDGQKLDVTFKGGRGDQEDTYEITSSRDLLHIRFDIAHPVEVSGRMLGIALKAIRVQRLSP